MGGTAGSGFAIMANRPHLSSEWIGRSDYFDAERSSHLDPLAAVFGHAEDCGRPSRKWSVRSHRPRRPEAHISVASTPREMDHGRKIQKSDTASITRPACTLISSAKDEFLRNPA
jgi:hypothetical protein